jgi:hypothetical protein
MSDGTFTRSPLQPEHTVTAIIPLGKPTVLGRRHSSSFSSMDAQYRALPQSPDVAQDIGIPSAIEDVDEESTLDEHVPSSEPVDTRIMWVLFMLGAAFLLPWNGTPETSCGLSYELNVAPSYDHRRTILPLTIATFVYTKLFCIVPRDYIHAL